MAFRLRADDDPILVVFVSAPKWGSLQVAGAGHQTKMIL